jgi:hypothetical protein|tara:strand:- start:1001 stop:1573 length:573 start_codon:yes stop_codon:yes gene_type:complete
MKKLRLLRHTTDNSFDTITAPTLEELNHEKNKLELEKGYLYDVCLYLNGVEIPDKITKPTPKTIVVFNKKTIQLRNDDEQWNDVRILNDMGGKDKETSTVLPHPNIQKNNEIVKDYLTYQPMTIFTPDVWYCGSVEFNAVAQYHKCGYDTFAKEHWDSWYDTQGQHSITQEERKYLPFVNYIKVLGYNYE